MPLTRFQTGEASGARATVVLGVFVKFPQPGRVKTRLADAFGPRQAADLYDAFTRDVIQRFRSVAASRWLCYWPADDLVRRHFEQLGLADYRCWPQPDVLLGERMQAFFEHAFANGAGRVVVIGSDSPDLPTDFVNRAFALLDEHDCVLGPAADGGYYLIGQRGMPRRVFADIEWSTPSVLADTVERITASGARLAMLPEWYDIDTPDDLERLRHHLEELRQSGGAALLPSTLEMLHRINGQNENAESAPA